MNNDFFTQRDLRAEPLYAEIKGFYAALHQPGEDFVSDAADVAVSPDGKTAAFTGTVFNDLQSAPVTRVCLADIESGELSRLPAAGFSDRYPRFSPDGTQLAFLSDRHEAGNFQLCVSSADGTAPVKVLQEADGLVEYFHWSPDGRYVLLGMAGFGADLAGCQGGTTTFSQAEDLPAWMPRIETADADNLWRWLSICDTGSSEVRRVTREGLNTWEACWLGSGHLISVCSGSHSEGSWYESELCLVDITTGEERVIYTPKDQIGLPAGTPDGSRIAIVEAVCSDRLIVAGKLLLIDPENGKATEVDTQGVDLTHTAWADDNMLVFTGLRNFETAVGYVTGGESRIDWASEERTLGNWNPAIWPLPGGGCAGVAEAYNTAPELVVIRQGEYRVICSLAGAACKSPQFSKADIEPLRWQAPDGLEIHGWLVKPEGDGPFPLVMDIHGGPVWNCRNRWMGRLRGCKALTDHGFAVLYPNPRGSSGRGLEYARMVKGDMGGADTHDYLSALDHLVQTGVADPDRIGTTGISYGGFMSCWLITQDQRFAAAVPISPVTNWFSQHRTSQIPFFDEYFLEGSAYESGGKFYAHSPVTHSRDVITPTLQLTGDLDQNTPPTQALEFHRALVEFGTESACVFYPQAGHGIRNFPDIIDHTTRKVGWFLLHMSRE